MDTIKCLALAAILGFSVRSGAAVAADKTPDGPGLLDVYRARFVELKGLAGHVQATGTLTELYPPDYKQPKVLYRLSYSFADQARRIRVQKYDGDKPRNREEIYLSKSDTNYIILNSSMTSPYFFQYKGASFDPLKPAFEKYSSGYEDPFLWLHKLSIETLLDSPDCRITACEATGEGPTRRVRISFDYHIKAIGEHLTGWWTVLPDAAWVLDTYETHRGERTYAGRISYRLDDPTRPIPVRVEASYDDEDGHRSYSMLFDRWTYEVPPRWDFALSSFDLADQPDGARRRFKVEKAHLLVGSGLAALIVAATLWVLSGKLTKTKKLTPLMA